RGAWPRPTPSLPGSRRSSPGRASSPEEDGLPDPELVGEPVDPVGLRLVVHGVVGRLPRAFLPLGGASDPGAERAAGADRAPPARLDEHLALRVVDPRERVDRL